MGLVVVASLLLGLGLLSRQAQSRDPRWSGRRLFGRSRFDVSSSDLPTDGARAIQFALGQALLFLAVPLLVIGLIASAS